MWRSLIPGDVRPERARVCSLAERLANQPSTVRVKRPSSAAIRLSLVTSPAEASNSTFWRRAHFLVVLSPVLCSIAAAIWITMGSPILYGQIRPGLHERPFRVWKFRTMTTDRDQEGQLLPDSQRLTRLGRWLRERSLDELPAIRQCPHGRNEPGWPSSTVVQILEQIHRAAANPTLGQAGNHGVGTGQWPQRSRLGNQARA